MGDGERVKEKYEKKIDNHSFYNYMAFVFDNSEGRQRGCTRRESALF
jgi:hypothetical protein